MVNEMAAVGIGKFLTDAATSAEDKARMEKVLTGFDQINIVYQQNTADAVHIVVPDFSDFDEAVSQARALADKELEQVSGGEIGWTVGMFFGTFGVAIASALSLNAVAAGGALGAGAIAIGAAVVLGSTAAGLTALAGVGAGIGVGIAAAVGAFDGNQAVNVGHNS